MANSSQQTGSGPPGYNDVVNSSIYTVPVSYQLQTPPAPVVLPGSEPTHGNNSSAINWLPPPPAYDSLFGVRPPKIRSVSQQPPDSVSQQRPPSAPQLQPLSTQSRRAVTVTVAATTERQVPSSTEAESTGCCEHLKSQRATKICTGIVHSSALVLCITVSAVGFSYECPANNLLLTLMQAFGIAGSVFLLLLGMMGLKKKDNKQKNGVMLCLFPVVLIGLFFAGSGHAYALWVNKPCNPGVGNLCSRYYCDTTLMYFSVSFYACCMILLLPLWLIILYYLLRFLFLCCIKVFCAKYTDRVDKKLRQIFDCFH